MDRSPWIGTGASGTGGADGMDSNKWAVVGAIVAGIVLFWIIVLWLGFSVLSAFS